MTSDEKVLCCIRLQNADMVLTSERIIVQSLPLKTSVLKHVLPPLTPELAYRQYGYVAWDDTLGLVLGPRGDMAPSRDRQNTIASARILHSLPYSQIREIQIERGLKGVTPYFAGNICTQEPPIPFQLDETRFIVFWHFISSILRDKIIFPDMKEMSRLDYIWITDLCGSLVEAGLNTEPVMVVWSDPTKGIIRFNGGYIDFLVKDTHVGYNTLDFIISATQSELRGLNLKTQRNREAMQLEWRGKDTELAKILNGDSTVMQCLLDMKIREISSKKPTDLSPGWSISLSSRKGPIIVADLRFEIGHFIQISNFPLQYLPTREFFDAMDKIAYHVRNLPPHY